MQHLDEGTIHAWLDGALSAGEGARIEAHLADCPACSAAVAEARGLIAGASRILSALDDVPGGVIPEPAPASAPPASPHRAPARVAEVADIATRRRRWLRAPYLSAAAGVLLVAVGTLVLGTLDRDARRASDVRQAAEAPSAAPADSLATASTAQTAPAPTTAAEDRVNAAKEPRDVPGAPRPGVVDRVRQQSTTPGLADAALRARLNAAREREVARVAVTDSPAAPPNVEVLRANQARKVAERADVAGAVAGAPAAVAAGAAPRRGDSTRTGIGAVQTGVLTGVVRDQATGRPLEGAQVYLPGRGSGAQTDAAGRYSIPGVPAGAHTVAVRRLGYQSAQRDVVVGADSLSETDFAVRTGQTHLSDVVVENRVARKERARVGREAEVAPRPAPAAQGYTGLAAVAPPSLTGCYNLSLGPWQPAVALREDSLVLRPPRRIELAAAALDERTLAQSRNLLRAYQVRPAPGSPASAHEAAYWIPIGADSVEIVWESGFSGLTMRLGALGGTLRGMAETFSDAGRQRQESEVTARRVGCGTR